MSPNTLIPLLAPLAILALVVRRSVRHTRVRVERLWLMPAILLFAAAAQLAEAPPPDVLSGAGMALALALGAAVGWWRGRLTRVQIDPATHEITSRLSPVGAVLVAGLFLARYGLRETLALSGPAARTAADGLLFFGFGLLSASRLELWVRCRALIAGAGPRTPDPV